MLTFVQPPSSRAFCAWNSASVIAPRSLRSANRCSSSPTGGAPAGEAPLVGLGTLVDHLLDLLRMSNVVEDLLTPLARGFHDEVAGADDPLEHALLETDVVDAIERHL